MIEANEYSFDVMRIFVGDFSPMIYVEILIRVIIILGYTMMMIRWIGKRAIGEIEWADLLLIIAMGSAVGDALFYPSIPLLVPLTVITLIAAVQKLYVYFAVKYEPIRKAMHPPVVKVVEHGKLLEANLAVDQIDINEVYMMLRHHGIRYLSEVEHAYFEQSGQLSIFKYQDSTYNNCILPEALEEVSVVK